MSVYQIQIDDDVINEKVGSILNDVFLNEMHSRYSRTNGEISEAVRELVYSHKDEIIDKVVSRATTEIVKKGIPKLIERFEQ